MRLGVAEAGAEATADPAVPSNRAEEEPDVTPQVLDKASKLLKPLLRDPSQAPDTAAKLVAVIETLKAPLPHPRILSGYEDVIAGSAREILDMARDEQRHRHRMENRVTAYPYFGMRLGGLSLLCCIAGAVFLAARGYGENIGLALIGPPMLTGVGWFINAKLVSLTRLPRTDSATPLPEE
jgi:uncharacterized membrane protein